MHYYTIYGLSVQSQVELPELCRGERADLPDVSIQYGEVSLERPDDPETTIWVENRVDPPRVRCGFAVVGRFEVREGRSIVVDPLSDVDPALVRHALIGPVLAYALWHRGYFALHASVLRVGEKHVGFVGESGQGKSTMAVALAQAGHALVCDDIAAIPWRESPIRVLPAFPHIRAYADTLQGAGIAPEPLRPVHSLIDKRLFPAPRFVDHSVVLDRIYVLETGAQLGVERLSPRDGMMQLMRHAYSVQYQAQVLGVARHMEMAASVAGQVGVYQLFRPKDLQRLPELVRFIEDASR